MARQRRHPVRPKSLCESLPSQTLAAPAAGVLETHRSGSFSKRFGTRQQSLVGLAAARISRGGRYHESTEWISLLSNRGRTLEGRPPAPAGERASQHPLQQLLLMAVHMPRAHSCWAVSGASSIELPRPATGSRPHLWTVDITILLSMSFSPCREDKQPTLYQWVRKAIFFRLLPLLCRWSKPKSRENQRPETVAEENWQSAFWRLLWEKKRSRKPV